ncbi:hypothetical protein [Mangrovicoccus ximenensis]|uniref:hypothetical protein n=1 Tax=Mangrovicoccus ximenensis TaxID=1911570 RepID=UPI000D37ED01|nr:hypothetical protein [Mangrovicoccus ximenensis]
MQPELATRRRVLVVTYERYIEADREWTEALGEVQRWFPAGERPNAEAMGEPGSRMRQIYESRMHALLQFEAAREKFHTARRRLAARSIRVA